MPTKIADGLAATAVSIPAVSWITTLNEYLQLGATAVGIVAGMYAVAWYRTRIAEVKRKRNEQSKRKDS